MKKQSRLNYRVARAALASADACRDRRTARAFERLTEAAERHEQRSKADGHPSTEPVNNQWEQPDSLEGR